MPPERKRPWRMFYPLILVMALGLAWSAYWTFIFTEVKAGVANARANMAADGAALTCARENWSGYPFRIEFTCDDAALTVKGGAQPMTLKARRLAAVVMAYNLGHMLAFVTGPSEINGMSVTHDLARISLADGGNDGFDIAAEVPHLAAGSEAQAAMVKIYARRKDGALDLAANADAITAAGVSLDRADFAGSTPAAILDAPDPVGEAARTGQPFTLAEAKVTKGDVAITAKGAIHLDPEKRLAGKIITETNDIDRLLAELAPKLQLSDANVAATKSMLAILAKDPNSKTRSADVIAQNGELYWGPFKLTSLPPLP